MTDTDRKPTEELGKSLLSFYRNGPDFSDGFDELLAAFLAAGELGLAIELLKLKKLDEIVGNIDKIAVEGITVDIPGLPEAIYALQP